MGFFSADMESMVEIYQRETMELLESFDNCLLQAVRRSRLTEEDINAIFRIVHTIKSASAMMGMAELSGCTHRMEDLFLLFRDVPARTQGNEGRIFDLLYAYGDYVKRESARVTQPSFQPSAADALLAQIVQELSFFRETAAPPASDHAPVAVPAAANAAALSAARLPNDEQPDGAGVGAIWRVTFTADCQMENVRAFMLLKQIRPLCQSISTIPSALEQEVAAAQIRQHGLLLTLVCDHTDEVARRLTASPYVLRLENLDCAAPEPDAPKPDAPAEAAENAPDKAAKFGMISWDQIVHLQSITGDLVTTGALLYEALHAGQDAHEIENILQTNQRRLRILRDLVKSLSMMPVADIMPQFYRTVRDICRQENKQVDFRVSGEDLQVDRNLLDLMTTPLLHLLRNAVDHGAEPPEARAALGKPPVATVTLHAEAAGGTLRFRVTDDGAGMDPDAILRRADEKGLLTKPAELYNRKERLNLIFLPGFSTNVIVNQYSGRGVGMDVVLQVVEQLGGDVSVESAPGKGTAVTMDVPVSMTSTECIRFTVGPHICLLPIRCVERVYSAAQARLQTAQGQLWLQSDTLLPVIDLPKLFGLSAEPSPRFVQIRGLSRSAVLLTGPVTGGQIAEEKPLPSLLGHDYRTQYGISGCSVVGADTLALVLNAECLLKVFREKEDGHVESSRR
ncbi:MAG: ATP-binding protein [Oscillospiraceae bacterium]|nr:ATP-binding protein [Oscillospiraceae bacterium]